MIVPALSCPLCQSVDPADYVLVAKAPNWDVLRCRKHGIEFANAHPAPMQHAQANVTLQRLYGTDAAAPSPRHVDFLDRVEQVVRPPGTLHDIGCATGQLLAEATRRGWGAQGNDVVDGIDVIMATQGYTYVHGALSDAVIPEASCDVVTSFCVLPHHLVDPLPDLHAVFRILRPDGWFVLELPDNGPYRKIARWLYVASRGRYNRLIPQLYQPGGHQFGYTRSNLTALLQAVGFTVVRIDGYYLDPHETVKRFAHRPWWTRLPMTGLVFGVQGASRLLRQPNHMIVFARKAAG